MILVSIIGTVIMTAINKNAPIDPPTIKPLDSSAAESVFNGENDNDNNWYEKERN